MVQKDVNARKYQTQLKEKDEGRRGEVLE